MAAAKQTDPKQTEPDQTDRDQTDLGQTPPRQTASQPDPEHPDNDPAETREPESPMGEQVLAETVGEKAQRRLAAQDKEGRSLWFGLGAFGVIGWSIAIPTLIGAAIGLWLDNARVDPFSWTLALLLAGVAVGVFNAWYWMSGEQRAMEVEQKRRSSTQTQGTAALSRREDAAQEARNREETDA